MFFVFFGPRSFALAPTIVSVSHKKKKKTGQTQSEIFWLLKETILSDQL